MPDSHTITDRQARLIIDNAVDYAIIGLDLHGVITSWNVGAANVMGWSAREAIGRPAQMIFTPEDVDAHIPAAEMSAAIRTGRGIDERWHLRKDGSRFWGNGEIMPLRNERGELEGYMKILRDRTAQHEVATALVESEDRYRTLHDAMEEGFCLIEVRCGDDARPIDYRFLETNAAFERHTGLADAVGAWVRDLLPQHEQHWFDIYARIALTGESARFELPSQALGRRYEVFAYRVGDPDKRVVAVLFSDITLRRAKDARLKDSEDHLRQLNGMLRGNEANLRLLLDTIGEGFYAVDRDGLTTTCNAAFLRMMGFARVEDVVGSRLHDLIHHSHPGGAPYAEADCPIYLAASAGIPAHVKEELFFPLHGAPLWVEYRATPILQDGVLQGAICTFQDVSEQRRRDQAQKKAEAFGTALLQLSDSLRDLQDVAAMQAAATGVIGATLEAGRVGYGLVAADNQTFTVPQDWTASGFPSLAGAYRLDDYGLYAADLRAGRTVVIDDVRVDPRTAADPEPLVALSVGALINHPVVEQGRIVAVLYVNDAHARAWRDDEVAFVRDAADRLRQASERRRAELDLHDLNARLESEVEARTAERDRMWNISPDLMVVMAPDGTYRRANPAWKTVLGYEPAELAGIGAAHLAHPDDSAATQAALGLAQNNALPSFENRFRHKDGSYRWIQWAAAPGGDEIFAIGRDVTASREAAERLVQAEEQLRQSQKMEAVGQLTGGLAHDFNNLLAGISGSIELMQMRMQQGRLADLGRYLTAAQGATRRAAALTHRLLAFSRRQTLDPKLTDVNRLVGGMQDMIQRTVGPAVALEVVGAAGLWPVLVDPSQLENALLNLCINARDAMPDGGRVTVETMNKWFDARAARLLDMPEGDYVSLCVSDSGTGMTPEVVARAFEPFFTTKPIGEGTGLGLSMIYGFAQQSGGQVRIYSEVGEGTTVCIYLPRRRGEADAGAAAGEGALPYAQRGATVLVVDDDATVRMLVVDILEELGYAAIEAADGREGLKILASDRAIDLLITDVGLPGGMNGRQMADAARVQRHGLKVLFITGYAENAVIRNGHLDPGMAVLTKPFAMDTMAARIQALIDAPPQG
ncbi:PAS domain S-box protein [Massilia forsythiae]|uniref:histidine kinase n=1 Tax=Massilia forsythiae TaxID=2728020 RepID=A0A7Z2VYF7_9BURK|nr:PAS domain S-box protein [Massilia forsythiae]QJE01380.1 PAS domain S-box protein [Massilia forsythiae]